MREPTAILIENGRLVDPSQSIDRPARLLLRRGRVEAIDPADGDIPGYCHRIDAGGCIVTPGLVDLGAEFREPGHEEDETIRTGGAAAVAGGYTSVLCLANSDPPIDTPAGVELVRRIAAEAAGPRVHVIACLSEGRRGEQMAELGLLVKAGAVAFSDSPRPIGNSALMKSSLDYCRMFDIPIFDRPVDPDLVDRGVMHEGQISTVLGLSGLPTEAEDLAVARDVRLAEATGGRLHVGPVSTMGSVDLIRRVKIRGISVTASVCPHNLWQSDEMLRSFDSRFKVHPPLRSERHVETLCAAVADGTIDAIQSGHMPRAREKKMNDLDQAPFGAATLETSLAVVATRLVHTGLLSWSGAIDRMSTAPAKIAGLEAGSLRLGAPADVTIIDPNETWTVDASRFYSGCQSSPHDGDQVLGRVVYTIVGGEVRYTCRPALEHLAIAVN
jgi:dihydroorotase